MVFMLIMEIRRYQVTLILRIVACHPVNCNQLRRVYADILGDLVDSTLIDDLLNQIYQTVDTVEKLSDTKKLAAIVRESNYGIS